MAVDDAQAVVEPPDPQDDNPPLQHPGLWALIGQNGFTVIGAVTFLLSIPSNIASLRFSEYSILYGYLAVAIVSICGFIVLGGLEEVNRRTVAALVLQIIVVGVFATPPLFAIWNSARERAPDVASQEIAVAPPTASTPATAPAGNARQTIPFRLEVR